MHLKNSKMTSKKDDFDLLGSNDVAGEINRKDVPDKYYIIIANFLAGYINDTEVMDHLNEPILKNSIKSVYWIFLIQYAVLAILGIVMNIAIIAYGMYMHLYKDVTQAFIINLALCHFVQCALVLPITLMVMMLQNWIFGQFLCFFLPMLQDIPLHVAMISHILIAWDRMRWLGDPMKGRLPAFVCCCATWLTGMVIALPFPIYTIYVEIGEFLPGLDGVGLCVVNLMDDMHEYMRGLFLIMYCAPAILLAYLYIRTSQELRPPDGPYAVMMFEHRADLRIRQRNSSASSADRSCGGGTATVTSGIGSSFNTTAMTGGSHTNGISGLSGLSAKSASRTYDLYSAELDVYREKRKQRNFGSMAATQVMCVCPLMVLRFARLSLEEDQMNEKHFDFTYLMFVWIAFLPTVIFPCIYASQILPRTDQERLRGYFRLSSHRLNKSRSDERADRGHPSDFREDSIEKDENTNTTQATSIITNAEEYISGVCTDNGTNTRHELKDGKHPLHNNNSIAPHRQGKASGGHDGVTRNLHKNANAKKNDVRINVISDGKSKAGASSRALKSRNLSGVKSNGSNSGHSGISNQPSSHTQRRVTIDSYDNNSCSNMTSSTYCNGNGSLFDEGGVSNFGDGEDSSIVSGMIVHGNSNSNPYYEKKWSLSGPSMRQKDTSFSDTSSFARMDSSSTLERDLEIMDMLERERSMDLQDMIEREQHGEPIRLSTERRRLPDIEKIMQRSPNAKLDPYLYDQSIASSSTGSAKDTQPTSSTTRLVTSDPLQAANEAYSATNTLNGDELPPLMRRDSAIDEEVPQDFFDNYTPGGRTTMPVATAAPVPYQYQYSRRLSRKSSHHSQNSNSHRSSKRDSFNSLNGTDLIAGAFGELDPTQPLTKMSVIENRMMRRSSGRNSSFSSSGRSSLKSRDYNHSSMHSAHPELDFRENIFAEL